MQRRFDFGRSDLTSWHERLKPLGRSMTMLPARKPTGQLIKSMISSRTRDEVSLAAYERLKAEYRSAAQLAKASPNVIERIIEDVTYAGQKAAHLVEALALIRKMRGDFGLTFLREWPVDDALAWLEQLPGVGRKVAASVLNASTLERPVLIVDSHVMRVLIRLGFIGATRPASEASEAVTTTMTSWTAADFLTFHGRMKRLGQAHCHHGKPDCDGCPLASVCRERARPRRARRPKPPPCATPLLL